MLRAKLPDTGFFIHAIMMAPNRGAFWTQVLPLTAVILLLAGLAEASVGDRLPEFKQCLDVSFLLDPDLQCPESCSC